MTAEPAQTRILRMSRGLGYSDTIYLQRFGIEVESRMADYIVHRFSGSDIERIKAHLSGSSLLGGRIARTLSSRATQISVPVQPDIEADRLDDLSSSDVAAWLSDALDYAFEIFASGGIPFVAFAESDLRKFGDVPYDVDKATYFDGRYYLSKHIFKAEQLFEFINFYAGHGLMTTLVFRPRIGELTIKDTTMDLDQLDALISCSSGWLARAYSMETYLVAVKTN